MDFEKVVLMTIRNLESIIEKLDVNELNQTMTIQLFNSINKIQHQLTNINETINKSQLDNYNKSIVQLIEFKKDFTNDIQNIITNTVYDKFQLIKEFNNQLIDKTKLLLDDLMPRNNDKITNEVNNIIKDFYNSLHNDTTNILNSTINKSTLTEFIDNIENKFSKTIIGSQQVFLNAINVSENHINSQINGIKNTTNGKIDEIKEITLSNNTNHNELQNNVIQLLKKMESSKDKGTISENMVETIINKLFPTANVQNVSNETGKGDFILLRNGKPNILIENKNYSKNVVSSEVDKFIADTKRQNCCGIFLSQISGITGKENYKIDIQDNNVLLYIHNVEYCADKIKVGIDIIDTIKFNIDKIIINNDCQDTNINIKNKKLIDNEFLELINEELKVFIKSKETIIKKAKTNFNSLINDIEEMKFPELTKLINTYFTQTFICDECQYDKCTNLAGLSAHKRTHNKKKTDEVISTITSTPICIPVTMSSIEEPTKIITEHSTNTIKTKQIATKKLSIKNIMAIK